MRELDWRVKSFDELTKLELFELLKIRQAVFVVEQTCAYADIDDLDKLALHLFASSNGKEIAAYARILPPDSVSPEPAIGRVLIAQAARGSGLGEVLMQRAIAEVERQFPAQAIKIGAQCYLQKFYESLGFEASSEPYDEDGIMHIDMLRS